MTIVPGYVIRTYGDPVLRQRAPEVDAIDGRIALANMGPTPLRARAAEQALAGGASPAEAAELAADGTEPGEDVHADRDYRRHLARVLTRRALEYRT